MRRSFVAASSIALLACGGAVSEDVTDAEAEAAVDAAETHDAPIDATTDGDAAIDTVPVKDCGCSLPGAACTVDTECCNLDCRSGRCGAAPTCLADHAACAIDGAPCCSGTCGADGTCAALSSACKTRANPCAANDECCSHYCNASTHECDVASFCAAIGDACARATDCCGGVCDVTLGAPIGTCAAPPPEPIDCSGAAGSPCGNCTDCCSRICSPDAVSGVPVCQPLSGCHVTGELCTRDSDCCGSAGSGLPGDGNVLCDRSFAPESGLGVCRNPLSCTPEGVRCGSKEPSGCFYMGGRNDCCDALGPFLDECILDAMGVPRCFGGEKCHAPGEACATSSGCCGNVPCVADTSGILRCATVTCQPLGASCTIDHDCCPGESCALAVGSVAGTCMPRDRCACSLEGQPCITQTQCCHGVCMEPAGAPCPGAGHGCLCNNSH